MDKLHHRILWSASIVLAIILLSIQTTLAEVTIEVISIQPAVVSNATSVGLTITGADFVDGAQVRIEGYGVLSTSFVSSTTLTALLPAGVSPGTYTVTVINPDTTSASLQSALQVVALTATVPAATVPAATQTPAPVDTQTTSERPLIVIDSYSASADSISPNQEFNLVIKLRNTGEVPARNLIATFPPGDCVPRESGGVLALTELDPGERKKFDQPFTGSYELWGKATANIVMQVSYTDIDGIAYSETFNISLPVTTGQFVPSATPTPTATPPPSPRPQLIIPSYSTNVSPLQPGTIFNLQLQITNKGDADARQLSMILGGGSASGGSPPGTPDTSGISGASGDFGTFAPVAASNVQFLGDLKSGASTNASADLIVNSAANPGAYPLRITFAYVDAGGKTYTDDQVITMLVFSMPLVDINFYRQPDVLFTGQPGQLPIQVVNLGRKATVLGTMKAEGENAQFSNNTTLVGALDVGGYFPLDAMVIPEQPGPLDILVSIDYTDDFNQHQVITKTLMIDVQEMIIEYPGPGEGGMEGQPSFPEPQPETFWQKVVRFLKGLIGLDSGQPTPAPGEMPPGELPPAESPGIRVEPSSKG
ncbi:MAG: hypothetical protein ACWGO1_05395 [Anaerolineales bacterium]